MVTNGWSARGPAAWIARATSSLPVPVSPEINTAAEASATWAMLARSWRIGALCPSSGCAARLARSVRRRRAFSRVRDRSRYARSQSARSASSANGLVM